jgi:hypothetical protein
MRAIVNSEFGPVENVEYFLRTMLPKFVLLLLKRGYADYTALPPPNRLPSRAQLSKLREMAEMDAFLFFY